MLRRFGLRRQFLCAVDEMVITRCRSDVRADYGVWEVASDLFLLAQKLTESVSGRSARARDATRGAEPMCDGPGVAFGIKRSLRVPGSGRTAVLSVGGWG